MYMYMYVRLIKLTIDIHVHVHVQCVIFHLIGGNDSFSSLTLLLNKDSSLSDWYKSTVQLPSSAQFNNFHINKVSLVLSDKENSPFLLLYSTHSHLVLQVLHIQ